MTVKYFALIRELAGKKEEALELREEASIQTLLSHLRDLYGEAFERNVCTSEGSLREGLILLLNGEAINRERFDARMLKDGDTVAIMPPVGGG